MQDDDEHDGHDSLSDEMARVAPTARAPWGQFLEPSEEPHVRRSSDGCGNRLGSRDGHGSLISSRERLSVGILELSIRAVSV